MSTSWCFHDLVLSSLQLAEFLIAEMVFILLICCGSCFLNRYASKEDDKWIKGLLKDLTVEAGSGLVVLDPVDMSWGYTSVKDKTNISLMSTDIYAHLSLSVISLILNLQSQAFTALQFGNADPLSPCLNFDQIWVSPKGLS